MTASAAQRPYLTCVVSPDGEAWWSLITTLQELKDDVGADHLDKTLMDAGPEWGVYAWVGDTSLQDALPPNQRVIELRDELLAAAGQPPHPAPLCGYVVLAAFARSTGESIHLPPVWRQALGPGGRFGWVGEVSPVP